MAVDVSAALDLVGTLTKYLAVAPAAGAAVAVGYRESVWPFLATAAAAFFLGLALEQLSGQKEQIGAREGYLVVGVTWLMAASVGALPYLLSGEAQLSRPLDAYFEGMSGFTTTGATVLTDIEALPRSLLLWRQATQWLGGMGIIVLAIAVLPRLRVGGRQLLESELPGHEIESLAARIRDTARRLWILYVGLTVIEVLILLAFGLFGVDELMTPFNAVAHGLTTLPTGGFSPENQGLAEFTAATQWLVIAFMVIAGTNFALTFRALTQRRVQVVARDEEFRLYIAIILAVATVLVAVLASEDALHGEAAVRHALFQTVSMMTTTGYASADFIGWPALATMLLIGLMFFGGSGGSTSGSVKVARHLLLGRVLRRDVDRTLHPEVVTHIRLNGRVADERVLRAVESFVLLYIGLFIAGAAIIAVDAAAGGGDIGLIDAIAASATTLGNVGPGLGFAGPLGSFEPFGDVSTATMVILMWMGRLELIPVLVLFSRHYWRS